MNQLKVLKAVVIQSGGTDKITLHLDAPTPFPEMDYEAIAHVEARQGYGPEWCRTVLGVDPEVIKTSR